MAVRKMPTAAFRIYSTGIEKQVHLYDKVKNSNDKGWDYSISPRTDDLAYADIVVIGHRENFNHYAEALKWHYGYIGKDHKHRKATKPANVAYMTTIRVYWCPPGSFSCSSGVVGIRDILLAVKSKKTRETYVPFGDRSPEDALKILNAFQVKHETGGYLTMRADIYTQRMGQLLGGYVNKKIIRFLASGKVNHWDSDRPGSRATKLWVESVHGKAMEGYLEFVESSSDEELETCDLDVVLTTKKEYEPLDFSKRSK